MQWIVLVALGSVSTAKSRLRAASASDAEHRELVEAIRADTLAAVRGSSRVQRVVVVSDVEGPGVDLVQRVAGLNAAYREAAEQAARISPESGLVAIVGDLAALRTADLDQALDAAAHQRRSFVADHDGVGTTMITALPGVGLEPDFGPGSAARHGATRMALSVGPSLRCDIDTERDLLEAVRLGVGTHTLAVVQRREASRNGPLSTGGTPS